MKYPLRFCMVLLASAQISAQTSQAAVTDGENTKRFEVVSIRPAQRSSFPPNIDEEDPCSASQLRRSGRTLSGNATTMYSLIALAHNPWKQSNACEYSTRSALISGGPAWIKSDRYAIQAVLPEGMETAAFEALQSLLQATLADRFGLVVRRGARDLPVYLIELDQDESTMRRRMGESLSAKHPNSDPRYGRGVFSAYPRGQDGGRYVSIAFNRQSLTNAAQRLVGAAERPVFDDTGLTGEFDFVLEYDPTGVLRPTLFTAVREQLGLRLVPSRRPIDVLVVERAERPSAN
jgi:uncharacterized protein (TIGR03435 family)